MNFKKNLINASVVAAVLTLTACGGSSSNDSSGGTVQPPANSAPTDISLTNVTVDENAIGAAIGTLSATDSNASDTHTYTVNDERFIVNGAELSLAEGVALDFETSESVDVEVTVTDSASASFTKTLTINVNDLLDTYKFASKFVDDTSSVSYSGQTARHALIAEFNHYIGNQLQNDLESGELTTRQAVINRLNKYFRTTEEQYDDFPITFLGDSAVEEQKYIAGISGSHKNLEGKIAGNDVGGQEKDWLTEFAGWGEKGSITPEGLIDLFFEQLADNAAVLLSGGVRTSETGEEITQVYINTDGTDLKQLIQKFLLMAVPYSQATADYLGEDTEGKGLTTDNSAQDGGTKPYTKLEHQFDEGFGYFGAARDYLAMTDDEIKANAAREDGKIDLFTEYNFGQSVNAAKRDLGTANNTNPTNYTQSIMEAFLTARNIINENAGQELTEDQMAALIEQRNIAVDGWERSIAATVVHYINDTIADLDKLGTDDFNYADLAKHWSEMKGFALGLQFNPYSKISDGHFEEIHTAIGNKPVLTIADVEAYKEDLVRARAFIAAALSFDVENVENW